MQSDLQSILGIQVQLDPRENTTYFNEIQTNPSAFFRSSWSADYPDPSNWDRLVFGPGSSMNFGHWANAEFTRLLDAADQTTDPTQRIVLYQQAEKVLVKDAGAVFLYWYGYIRLVKPWVSGLTITAKDPEMGAFLRLIRRETPQVRLGSAPRQRAAPRGAYARPARPPQGAGQPGAR